MMLFSNSTPYVWSQGLLLNPWLTHWQDWLSSHSKHLHVYPHPKPRLQMCATLPCCVLGIQTQIFMLVQLAL